MSQATLAERAYRNSNLFSSHYLDERVEERGENIQRTDDIIDEIGYEGYGLTDE